MIKDDMQGQTRCGFCAVIGAPNAGKSTLVNRLVEARIAIVTHKVQTTRTRLRGIALINKTQIIFVDTPGIFAPRRKLDEVMVAAAWQGVGDADVTLLLIDAQSGVNADVERILETLGTAQPVILVLNKIDLIAREKLLALAQDLNERFSFSHTFMISALNGDGVDDLRAQVASLMPPGPWAYPEDQIADLPMRLLAAELTREQLYLRLHQELPYESTVETESWKEQKDGSVRIEQVIYVARDGQKKIIIGKNGQTLKAIGQRARTEIAAALEQKVHLFLFVKVRANWDKDDERLRQMGLDI